MTITAFACAEFHDAQGNVLHRITAGELNQVLFHVPDTLWQDPLFAMMVNEGTIVMADGMDGIRKLEKAAEQGEKPKTAKKTKAAARREQASEQPSDEDTGSAEEAVSAGGSPPDDCA